jgi:hypothetical protein
MTDPLGPTPLCDRTRWITDHQSSDRRTAFHESPNSKSLQIPEQFTTRIEQLDFGV